MKPLFFSLLATLALITNVWAEPLANTLPEPIQIDPSYNECFQMAQEALKSEQAELAEEAQDLKSQPDPQTTYSFLKGEKDFETALLESGAEITIDPKNPHAAPTVTLKDVALKTLLTKEDSSLQADAEQTGKPSTDDDLYQLKKDVCRIKYGISF